MTLGGPITRWRHTLAALGACLLAANSCPAAVASGHGTELAGLPDYQYTAWSVQEDAPADIWAIEQSPDGYLWLGTGFGLFRFDGVTFEPVPLAHGERYVSNNITALATGSRGALWIGYFYTGISLLQQGHIRHYAAEDGVPAGTTVAIVEDREGTVWMASVGGLARFRDGHWQRVAEEMDYPWRSAYRVFLDSRGTLWVANEETVVYRPAGDPAFRRTGVRAQPYGSLAEAPDGSIWFSDPAGTRPIAGYEQDHLALRESLAAPPLAVFSQHMLVLEDGTLWGTDAGRGGVFIATPRRSARGDAAPGYRLEGFGARQGLASDVALPFFRDRERNLWVGTNMGLGRLRHKSIAMLPLGHDLGYGAYGLSATPHGLLLAFPDRVMRADRTLVSRVMAGTKPADFVAPAAAWMVDVRGIWRLQHGRREPLPLPAGAQMESYAAAAIDPAGRPWLALHEMGVYQWRNGRWMREDRLPNQDASVIVPAADGTMWFGYAADQVAVLRPDGVRTYTAADGLAVGNVTTMQAMGDGMVVAGELGIAIQHGDLFRTLEAGNSTAFRGVTGMAVDEAGNLWLNGSKGIVRVSPQQLRRAATTGATPEFRLFDALDGLAGVALQSVPVPTAGRSDDGLMWFATNQGIAVIDPAGVPRNDVIPNVLVRGLRSGSLAFSGDSPIELPKRTSNVQIPYTATSLTLPERVNFRYRLEGVDAEWRDAGSRREAFYTNLGPGHYVFSVTAANDDGLWNPQPARLEFTILPTFVQTSWFGAACALFAAATLYTAYLLHLRGVAARMRERLEERHLERERIARELHDTLLQSVQGLILRIHVQVSKLRRGDPLRAAMEDTMDRAEEAMIEFRDSVRELRAPAARGQDLAAELRAAATETAGGCDVPVSVEVTGQPRAFQPLARHELQRIGREAIVNALRHGTPRCVEVRLVFDEEEFRLSVRDDGCGIDAAVLASGTRGGHFGLAGMRERAERLRGRFLVRSAPGEGTEICIALPGHAAYLSGADQTGRPGSLRSMGGPAGTQVEA